MRLGERRVPCLGARNPRDQSRTGRDRQPSPSRKTSRPHQVGNGAADFQVRVCRLFQICGGCEKGLVWSGLVSICRKSSCSVASPVGVWAFQPSTLDVSHAKTSPGLRMLSLVHRCYYRDCDTVSDHQCLTAHHSVFSSKGRASQGAPIGPYPSRSTIVEPLSTFLPFRDGLLSDSSSFYLCGCRNMEKILASFSKIRCRNRPRRITICQATMDKQA